MRSEEKEEWLKKNHAVLVHECEHSEIYLCYYGVGGRRENYMLEISKG